MSPVRTWGERSGRAAARFVVRATLPRVFGRAFLLSWLERASLPPQERPSPGAINEDVKARYAEAIATTLGYEGRMISYSKSGYHERNPSNVAIFNANVCIASGKLWHGDLDLTLDEPKLAALAEQTGEIVWVLYEGDGRFEHEQQPLLVKAVYSVAPSGHTRFDHRFIERTESGMLQRRPPKPHTRRRFTWRVFRLRPRLLRFWRIERQVTRTRLPDDYDACTLVYVGTRDSSATPLLVLGFIWAKRLRALAVASTWYPTHPEPRGAPRALLSVTPSVRLGRLTVWFMVIVWPGFMYELRAGYALRRRWL